MKEFKDKVAVITGAASGIGLGIAERCIKEEMKVVLADINRTRLKITERRMKRAGATVIAVLTDVSKARDVKHLARETLDTFGECHLLCNNAGGGMGMANTPIWEYTLEQVDQVIGANLMGVIHGVRTFIPIMLEQDIECHIVNTSSGYGLISGEGIYGVSKHGVTTLSEIISTDLARMKAKVKVSILIPIFVWHHRAQADLISGAGLSPEDVADILFQGLKENKFYIITESLIKTAFKKRTRKIMKAIDSIKQIK